MFSMDNVIWNLKSKSINVVSYSDENDKQACFVSISTNKQGYIGWEHLINRLNKVYNNPFKLVLANDECPENMAFTIMFNNIKDKQKLERDFNVLCQCIINEEYKLYPVNGCDTFDIKLGISCNNNCFHCVIKPQVYQLKKEYPEDVVLDSGVGMQCFRDLTFLEAIDTLKNISEKFSRIILTGGEPTIRKDFINIVKWIYYNKPYANISIQTNGRNLLDMNLVKQIRRYTRFPDFAVALHGLEKTHNKIVNNRKEQGNPFQETVQGLKNLTRIFDENIYAIRTEIVLSSYNIDEILETIKFTHEELGIKHIGISYPHLANFKEEDIKKISPNMDKVFEILCKLNKYNLNHDDLKLIVEEVPFCIFNRLKDNIKLESVENRCRADTTINFAGDQQNDFHEGWLGDHSKFKICKECILNKECIGIWKEAVNLVESSISPVKKLSKNMEDFLNREWNNYTLDICDKC